MTKQRQVEMFETAQRLIAQGKSITAEGEYLMTEAECTDAELQFYWKSGHLKQCREIMMRTMEQFGFASVTIQRDGTLTWVEQEGAVIPL